MEGEHSPQVRSDGVRHIFVQDPDGYWIEINDSLKKKSSPPAQFSAISASLKAATSQPEPDFVPEWISA
jgi:hypothetical protein